MWTDNFENLDLYKGHRQKTRLELSQLRMNRTRRLGGYITICYFTIQYLQTTEKELIKLGDVNLWFRLESYTMKSNAKSHYRKSSFKVGVIANNKMNRD
jgi:hypothetical protein